MTSQNASGAGFIELLESRTLFSLPVTGSHEVLPVSNSPGIVVLSAGRRKALPLSPISLFDTSTGPNITLYWTDGANDKTGFRIERWTGVKWVQIARVGPEVMTFTDTGLALGTPYAYRVFAFNSNGLSKSSAFIGNAVTSQFDFTKLPSDLTVLEIISQDVVRHDLVQFMDNATDEIGYTVEVATYDVLTNGPGPWTSVATLPATTTTGLRTVHFNSALRGASQLFRVVTESANHFIDRTEQKGESDISNFSGAVYNISAGPSHALLRNGQYYTFRKTGLNNNTFTLSRYSTDGTPTSIDTIDSNFGTKGSFDFGGTDAFYDYGGIDLPAGLPNGKILAVTRSISATPSLSTDSLTMRFGFYNSGPSRPVPAFVLPNQFTFSASVPRNAEGPFPPNPRIFVERDGSVLIATDRVSIPKDRSTFPRLTLLNADLTLKWSIPLPVFPDAVAGLPFGGFAISSGSSVAYFDSSFRLI